MEEEGWLGLSRYKEPAGEEKKALCEKLHLKAVGMAEEAERAGIDCIFAVGPNMVTRSSLSYFMGILYVCCGNPTFFRPDMGAPMRFGMKLARACIELALGGPVEGLLQFIGSHYGSDEFGKDVEGEVRRLLDGLEENSGKRGDGGRADPGAGLPPADGQPEGGQEGDIKPTD